MRAGVVVAAILFSGCTPTASKGPQSDETETAGMRLYVAPNGNDANSGTRGKPFATLTRARDEIRKRKTQGGLPAGGVTVEIAGGRYALKESFVLSKEDSGTAAAPVVYRCAPDARAWLYGGLDVPAASLAPLEVFCDGRALTPARWPNDGFVQVDEVLDDGEGSCFSGDDHVSGARRAAHCFRVNAGRQTRYKEWQETRIHFQI